MPRADGSKDLFCGNGAAGVRLHGIADSDDFVAQPLLDRGIAFLQCAQSGSHHFTAGGVGAACNKAIDVISLLGGQAESSFLR